MGMDGKPLLCHQCGSDQHLLRECPEKRHMAGGRNAGGAYVQTPGGPSAASSSSGPRVRASFFISDSEAMPHIEEVAEDDFPLQLWLPGAAAGDPATGGPAIARTTQGSNAAAWFPWWPSGKPEPAKSFLQMVQRRGEGLLVDPGSPDNLVGEAWSKRQAALTQQAGAAGPRYKDVPDFRVGGVGKEAQVCKRLVKHAVALDDGERGDYEAMEIPASEVPALLGLHSLTRLGALIDVANLRMFRVGPGGYKVHLSPGNRVNALERADTGHLLLPCSEFAQEQRGRGELSLLALTEPREGSDSAAE